MISLLASVLLLATPSTPKARVAPAGGTIDFTFHGTAVHLPASIDGARWKYLHDSENGARLAPVPENPRMGVELVDSFPEPCDTELSFQVGFIPAAWLTQETPAPLEEEDSLFAAVCGRAGSHSIALDIRVPAGADGAPSATDGAHMKALLDTLATALHVKVSAADATKAKPFTWPPRSAWKVSAREKEPELFLKSGAVVHRVLGKSEWKSDGLNSNSLEREAPAAPRLRLEVAKQAAHACARTGATPATFLPSPWVGAISSSAGAKTQGSACAPVKDGTVTVAWSIDAAPAGAAEQRDLGAMLDELGSSLNVLFPARAPDSAATSLDLPTIHRTIPAVIEGTRWTVSTPATEPADELEAPGTDMVARVHYESECDSDGGPLELAPAPWKGTSRADGGFIGVTACAPAPSGFVLAIVEIPATADGRPEPALARSASALLAEIARSLANPPGSAAPAVVQPAPAAVATPAATTAPAKSKADFLADYLGAIGRDSARAQAAIAAGMDANARNPQGQTVLDLAVRAGDASVVRALLAAQADPNALNQDAGGFPTVLFNAVYDGSADVVAALLDGGADPNVKQYGDTPMRIAKDHHDKAIIELLKAHGGK